MPSLGVHLAAVRVFFGAVHGANLGVSASSPTYRKGSCDSLSHVNIHFKMTHILHVVVITLPQRLNRMAARRDITMVHVYGHCACTGSIDDGSSAVLVRRFDSLVATRRGCIILK